MLASATVSTGCGTLDWLEMLRGSFGMEESEVTFKGSFGMPAPNKQVGQAKLDYFLTTRFESVCMWESGKFDSLTRNQTALNTLLHRRWWQQE